MDYEKDRTIDEIVNLIVDLLKEKKYIQARSELLNINAVDVAEILRDVIDILGIEIAVILFRTLPKDMSVEVFSYLNIEKQIAIINVITEKEIHYIIEELAFDDMIDVLEELPANIVDKVLANSTKEKRKQINTFELSRKQCRKPYDSRLYQPKKRYDSRRGSSPH